MVAARGVVSCTGSVGVHRFVPGGGQIFAVDPTSLLFLQSVWGTQTSLVLTLDLLGERTGDGAFNLGVNAPRSLLVKENVR